MCPFSDAITWDIKGIVGTRRFLDKVWKLFEVKREIISAKEDKDLDRLVHKTIKKVTDDILNFRFNTAVSSLMVLVNSFSDKNYGVWHLKTLLLILAPFAPHISEELWQSHFARVRKSNFEIKDSVHGQSWPKYDSQLAKEETITLVIQINGRVRDKIEVAADISEEKAKELALSQEKIKKWIYKEKIEKVIFVPGKLINIVVK
jgi:leucyl-tRNA synthetase